MIGKQESIFTTLRSSPPKPEIAILEIPYPLEILRRRHSKSGPFWVTSFRDVPEGVVYIQFQKTRRAILELNGRNIRLDGPRLATSASVLVTAFKPTSKVEDLHDMATSYWSSFWDSEDKTDLDKIDALLDHAPVIPAFAPSIDLREIKEPSRSRNPTRLEVPTVGQWPNSASCRTLSCMVWGPYSTLYWKRASGRTQFCGLQSPCSQKLRKPSRSNKRDQLPLCQPSTVSGPKSLRTNFWTTCVNGYLTAWE